MSFGVVILMKYELESQLVDDILDNIDCLINNDNIFVSQELEVGSGRADIVISEIDYELFQERININSSFNQSNSTIIAILSVLYDNMPLKKTTIAKKTNIRISKLNKLLNELVKEKIIIEEDEKYIKNINFFTKNNLVVEAKLSKWKKALEQAYRNKLYANKSYVILDKKRANGAIKNINEFITTNIGLGVIDRKTKELEIIFKPKSKNKISKYFKWLANEKIFSKWNEDRILIKKGGI